MTDAHESLIMDQSINSKNKQLTALYQATVSADDNRPTYVRDGINGIPVIDFDGTDDFLNLDLTALVSTDYAIFIVNKTTDVDAVDECLLTTYSPSGYSDRSLHLCHQDSVLTTTGLAKDWFIQQL